MEADKYKGQKANEVAKNLNMNIDDFLDEIFDKGYYCCSKCGEIVDVKQLCNDLDTPCDKCKVKKFEVFELSSGIVVYEPFEAKDRETALEEILETRGQGIREVTDE